MKKLLLSFTIISALIFTVSCTKQQKPQQPTQGMQSSLSGMADIQRVKVTANQVNVKSGCSNGSSTINTSSKDSTLDVLSKVSDWYAVKLSNNAIGFVPQSQVKPIAVEEQKPTPVPGTQGSPLAAPNTQSNPGAQTDSNSGGLTAEEQQMLNLVNQARAQNNVPTLQVDMKVTNTARLKSQDMINNNYFSHNSPTYGSPFDMMKSFGISYVKAGENIAGNQSVQAAHNALMNSSGHRKNILDPDFTHIGIGIKKGGSYGNMFTQQFVSRPK
jgi:uncharacterized YkwD family protein